MTQSVVGMILWESLMTDWEQSERRVRVGVVLLLSFLLSLLLTLELHAQTNFCANPAAQTVSEKGSPLTLAEFDNWLENVRYVCTSADVPADEECFTYEATGDTFEWQTCGSGGSSAFTDLTSGTNTTAAMVIGTGASLTTSGSGTITATSAASATTATTASDLTCTNCIGGTEVDESSFGAGTFSLGLTVDGATVLNEAGADVDFRVEGVASPNLLFADASTGRVGVGTDTPQNTLTVGGDQTVRYGTSATSYGAVYTTSNRLVLDSVQSAGALIDLSPLPQDGTSTGMFRFFRFTTTTGATDAVWHRGDGTSGVRHLIGSSSVTFNESGEDIDLRVEGDTNANTLIVDAGANSLCLFGACSVGSGNAVAFIGNATTAPSTNPANGVILYSADIATSAELHVRDEAGNITILSDPSLAGKIDDAQDSAFDTTDTPTDGETLKWDLAAGKIRWGAAGSAAFTNLDADYGAETITSDFDFGGGILQVPNSTTLPGTCDVGDAYMDTDAPTGERWYLCESANAWTLQGGAGSGPYDTSYHPDRPPTTCNACEETGSDLTWAWANQDSATITAELDTLLLDSVNASGGATTHERNVRWTSLPSAVDWVVTTKMSMGGALDANTDSGLIILASGTRATPTSMYLLSRGIRSASFDSFQTLCRSVTSYTSATTDIGGPESTQHGLGPWWLQFRFNTTTNTLSCHLSQDGMTWVAMAPGQVLGGDPTDVGIFVDARSVAGTIQARYEYIRVRTDAAGLAGQVGE